MRHLVAINLALCLAVSLTGCVQKTVYVTANNAPTTMVVVDPNAPKEAILAFIDISASVKAAPKEAGQTEWQAGITEQLLTLNQIVRSLPRNSAWIELYTIENTVVQRFKNKVRDERDLNAAMKTVLQQGPSKESGTYFEPVNRKLVERAKEVRRVYPSIPVVCLLLTDGGVDDIEPATRAERTSYSECGNVRFIAAMPVRDEMRTRLDRVYASFRGDGRFEYASTLDSKLIFDKIKEALTKPFVNGGL